MTSYTKLLLENKAWANAQKNENPQFFERLSALQTPEFLWIGCSDSRVPADKITGTQPAKYSFIAIFPIWWHTQT